MFPPFQENISQCILERLINHLVEPERAKQRIAAKPRDNLRLAREDAGLRPSQKLVATEGNQVGAGSKAVGNKRLVDAERAQIHDATAAQILIHGQIPSAAKRYQLL